MVLLIWISLPLSLPHPWKHQSLCENHYLISLFLTFYLALDLCGKQSCKSDPQDALTLKGPGGGGQNLPLLNIFCYISASCYFFARKLHDFFPCARFKTIFKKIGPRVMTRRCVIEPWVQRKTDQKLIFNGN